MQIESVTPEETILLAREFGKQLKPNVVVCFFGDLGSGKTTFIKGVVEGFTGYSAEDVNSPTFNYLNIYAGAKQTVYHFDLYRLRDVDEFLSMGFDDYLTADGVCCIEWSERIDSLLPADCIRVRMHLRPANGRIIEITSC